MKTSSAGAATARFEAQELLGFARVTVEGVFSG